MPKGKKKGKFEHRRTEQLYSSDEDAGIDMTNDNFSETSAQSDMKSTQEDTENDTQEKLEEKVLEIIDNLNAKSSASRATALVSLRAALSRRPLFSLLSNHKATLADHLVRTLKRGKDAEKMAAAAVVPIVSLQIGEEGSEEFVAELRPALAAACNDRSSSVDTRSECCSALAALCYLFEEDLVELSEVLQLLEGVFAGCFLKGDGSVKLDAQALEEAPWHAAALDGWALLLPLLPGEAALQLLPARLPQALRSASLEVRVAGGLALAGAKEAAPALCVQEALPALRTLATDSQKHRARKERRVQRATFRDVLGFMAGEAGAPALALRVAGEAVRCDSWAARAAYAALADALGGGLQALAPASPALRHALGLGEPQPPPAPLSAQDKHARHLQMNAASKARTVARNKNRDKRSAALAL